MGAMMPSVNDVMAYEAGELDEKATAKMMQGMVNSGMAWRMQGSYGRAAMRAIEAGQIMLGKDGHRDYWGNYVPGRKEVKAGTKGSFGYVAEAMGNGWALSMAKV